MCVHAYVLGACVCVHACVCVLGGVCMCVRALACSGCVWVRVHAGGRVCVCECVCWGHAVFADHAGASRSLEQLWGFLRATWGTLRGAEE